jgi:hypothetical protein
MRLRRIDRKGFIGFTLSHRWGRGASEGKEIDVDSPDFRTDRFVL